MKSENALPPIALTMLPDAHNANDVAMAGACRVEVVVVCVVLVESTVEIEVIVDVT